MKPDVAVYGVKTVSFRRRNPFGMQPPCEGGSLVPGYGDPAGDFHVIGDHPGRHGGVETGIPFTGHTAGKRMQSVLHSVGLVADPYAEEPDVQNLFLDYLHMCTSPHGGDPQRASYARLERFFDAELRAVNAHILVTVGARATDHVLAEYTTQQRKVPADMGERHATEVRGRGFLVVPVKEPASWSTGDQEEICTRLQTIYDRDYRQTKGVATLIG